MSVTQRLTGRVSEPIRTAAYFDTLSRELREVLAENDRLILRNKSLKRRLDTALVQIADLEASSRRLLFDAPGPEPAALTVGRLRINYDLRRLELDGRTVHLTQRGMEILGYLMGRPDRVVQTKTLANVLGMPGCNAVRQLMWRTRPALVAIGAERYLRSYGRTWSGGGYWMSADHEPGGQP
jgi:DNA-binding response OmpR family regulator